MSDAPFGKCARGEKKLKMRLVVLQCYGCLERIHSTVAQVFLLKKHSDQGVAALIQRSTGQQLQISGFKPFFNINNSVPTLRRHMMKGMHVCQTWGLACR